MDVRACQFFLRLHPAGPRLTMALTWLLACAGAKTPPPSPAWLPWPEPWLISDAQTRQHVQGDTETLEFYGRFLPRDLVAVITPLLPFVANASGRCGGQVVAMRNGELCIGHVEVWTPTTLSLMAAALEDV